MQVVNFLYGVIIEPLILLFETLFSIFYGVTNSYGVSIILLSLCMNILVLPLYRRADAIQDEENRIEKKLEKKVAHIKKTFKGDERYMMLQTYYRQNNYKPSYVLKGLLPLLLEIPFFMAAYSFLSNLECLQSVSFGPIVDLSLPDKMIGSINLLPILMTVINIVSSTIYLKEAPLKSKIQLFLMAGVFLVLLYNSPSGLVLYWTLNNLFSLVKNIITKAKNPKKIVEWMLAGTGFLVFVSLFTVLKNQSIIRKCCVLICALALEFPLINNYIKLKLPKIENRDKSGFIFFVSCLFMAILTGLYIPLTVIKSSPGEFIDYTTVANPLSYVLNSFYLAIGIFVVWIGIYYLLADKETRNYFAIVMVSVCFAAVVNYLLFDTDLGNMSKNLVFDEMFKISISSRLINLLIDVAIVLLAYLLWNKIFDLSKTVISVVTVALIVTSVYYVKDLIPSIEENQKVVMNSKEAGLATTNLSTEGKNVILIMLDRGISKFIPYIFNEKPELYDMFEGFTFYPNTLAYGTSTNVSTPSLFGGYEYTPEKIQERTEDMLVDKQNEALKVLPVLFSNEDYEVTVCDPSYANYNWVPDLSIFDEYENIDAYNTNNGEFLYVNAASLDNLNRNLFCYGLFRVSPSILKTLIYNGGNYHSMAGDYNINQTELDVLYEFSGENPEFTKSYAVLDKMESITKIVEGEQNTYFSIVNDTTHAPTELQEPDYMPTKWVDNSWYDETYKERYSWDGDVITFETEIQKQHYQTNMCAFLLLGDWLEYLKENDVYDNTRIIICSDHGRDFNLFDLGLEAEKESVDVIAFNALLMVKDFGDEEFKVSNEFMTLADIPTLLTDDLIEDPVNPMTGNPINSDEKTGTQKVLQSPFGTEENNGNTFIENDWFEVQGNVLDINSWKKVTE